MAPPRKDKGTAHVPKRKRGSTSAEASAFDGTLFRSFEASTKFYSDFHCRKVLLNKHIDFEYFMCHGLELEAVFEKVGWLDYVCMNEVVYPRLVAMFYANMEEDSNHQLSSYVKGVPIRLKCSNLAEAMDIVEDPSLQYVIKLLNRQAALESLLQKQVESAYVRVNIHQCPAYIRLLHKIVCSIFLPRSGGMDGLSDDHILIIKALIDGANKVDIVTITLNYMRDVILTPKRNLIFGMIITRLLKKFKVNLVGEEGISLSRHDMIDELSLNRMNLSLSNGVVSRTRTGNTPQKGQSSTAAEEEPEDFIVRRPSVDFSALINGLGDRMDRSFASLGSQLSSLDTKVTSLDCQVSQIAAHQESTDRNVYLLTTRQEETDAYIRGMGQEQAVMSDNLKEVKSNMVKLAGAGKNLWNSFFHQHPPPPPLA